ncbi:exopolysaccharide biosynthesis polyprenyl glycosylphosphotransferase [Bacillus cereus VD196]|uniref:Exopolysaccharide biosynthesis polyprenyl glycosylphosphotransferase n=1 Tax=Bacillus cereus VD196 TaxID=1053243 RepID=A0A9W5PYH3_BACCE|nr:exopolysaccharide biosynthesis polyprenyl glycosylphosphotransferase [Bacillus cereus]EJR93398.1 exopolysaccharide biosynthesis polyprenyl glycosylphosphotransferase [Bacillus cereus VD200]EOO61615.1 exopolysaccharide biosynthesis polyprenyl glycosylphosphotransferase [Bacillus cereus VD196]
MKAIFDICFSIILFILTIPIMLIVAILIKIDSKGSILYTQERVGKDGKLFKLLKFRSMIDEAEKDGAKWAEKDDPRITRVGKIIRKTRIDELPQLFNVIQGDMSIIGPRPERMIFTEKFEKDHPGFKERLVIKPGLTGWAQVNGGYDLSPVKKLNLDLYYIENLSFKLEMKILLKTIYIVITGKGSR